MSGGGPSPGGFGGVQASALAQLSGSGQASLATWGIIWTDSDALYPVPTLEMLRNIEKEHPHLFLRPSLLGGSLICGLWPLVGCIIFHRGTVAFSHLGAQSPGPVVSLFLLPSTPGSLFLRTVPPFIYCRVLP